MPENRKLKVFLCHAQNDKPKVRRLCRRLRADGFDAWLDEERLMPGQDWDMEIQKTVRESDVVLVCLSNNSITKAGYVQKEIRFALDMVDQQPENSIYVIPTKLEECQLPSHLKKYSWAELFKKGGYSKLVLSLQRQANQRGIKVEKEAVKADQLSIKEVMPPQIPDPKYSNNQSFGSYRKIGRYTIKDELGRGGMAIVYLGHDPEIDREVAIKVLQTEYLYRDTDSKARFRREIQTIARFEDPSIVQLYDVGEENGQPYFVMRYMRGGSLEDKLKDGPLPLQEAFRLLEQIAPGLDEAHSKGVIHRDLKPGNILFDNIGKPSIADFGVAKILRANPSIVTNEGTLGTPAYMAPEQIMGGDVDGRADIYALGIILYQTLTGKLPFEAHMRNLGIATRTAVPSILDENPALPPWVESIITKAMAADRSNRYKTVGEMVGAIRMQMEGKPSPDKSSAGKAGASPRRIAIVSGFFLIAALLFAVGGSLFQGPTVAIQTDTETADEFVVTITSPPPTVIQTKASTPTDMPTATLPAPSLPILGGADKVAFLNNNNIWVMNVDGNDLKPLTTDETEKFNLQWLPDGKEILYITGKTIKTVNIDTKEESVITSFGASDYFESFRISPDGKQAAISLARELHVVDFDLDQIKKATTKDDLLAMDGCLHYTSEEVEDVRWSKDGKKLAIKFAASTIGGLKHYIRIINIQFCKDSHPLTVDEFPGDWFDFFTDDIISFDWNGNNREGENFLFIMDSDNRNEGFGKLGIYNNASYSFSVIAPIKGTCCYRDAVFSPDGSYVLFAFQDIRLGEFGPIEFYYQPYASLEANSSFIPVPLPDGFFGKRTDSPSPVLRPSK